MAEKVPEKVPTAVEDEDIGLALRRPPAKPRFSVLGGSRLYGDTSEVLEKGELAEKLKLLLEREKQLAKIRIEQIRRKNILADRRGSRLHADTSEVLEKGELAEKEKLLAEKEKLLAKIGEELVRRENILAEREKLLAEKEKQLHETQMQQFCEMLQENKKLGEKNIEIMELEYQLKEANKDMLRLLRKLYAMYVFEQYEKKLEELWNTERPDETFRRNISREEKWNNFLTLDVFQVRKFLEVVKNRKLPVEGIPEIARDIYDKLNTGIHKGYGTGLMKIILDPTILNEQELDFMLCVIERTPLDVDTDVIIQTFKIKEENGQI